MKKEFVDVEDLFENEDIVVMKAKYFDSYLNLYTITIDIGIKDSNGDISRIITIKSKTVEKA